MHDYEFMCNRDIKIIFAFEKCFFSFFNDEAYYMFKDLC